MRMYARVPVVVLVVGVVGAAACSPFPPPSRRFEPVERLDTIFPITCEPLMRNPTTETLTTVDTLRSSDPRPLVVELPFDSDEPMVRLTVPPTALSDSTADSVAVFRLESPAATPFVYVHITAFNSVGDSIADFADDLELALRVEDRDCNLSDRGEGSTAYLYNIKDLQPDTVMVISEGMRSIVLRAGRGGKGWIGTYRARGTMDSFSGYIVAQGRH